MVSNIEVESLTESLEALCAEFPATYWRGLDESRAYPTEFVRALSKAGYLSALIPEEFGGGGLGLREGCVILETINRSGANGGACHAQMYTMGSILKFGSEAQKKRYLPSIAAGEVRLQAFAVTEAQSGSDTTSIRTFAKRSGNTYVVSGEKVYISRVRESDLMLLLARTTPSSEVSKKTEGLSLFIVDMRVAQGITVSPIRTMMNHSANVVVFDGVEVPEENLIGEEGRGFTYVLESLNAERILIASESIGDGRWFIDKARRYASERVVFGRPIGANQGVQFPIARAHAAVEAASLMRFKAAALFDSRQRCGADSNMAKLLSSEAAWSAANACLDCYGGNGFATEYDIERKFRETRLYLTAPVNNNLILGYLGEHVLGMPRSY